MKKYDDIIAASQKPTDHQKEIDKLNKRLKKIKELYIEDLLPKEEYKEEYESIHKQLEELKPIRVQIPQKKDFKSLKALMDSDFDSMYETLDQEEKREFWSSTIEKFYVLNGEITGIEFY